MALGPLIFACNKSCNFSLGDVPIGGLIVFCVLNKASNTVLKSEAYIDSLQRELRDELDIIIEAQELF